ncbi:MAG: GAF domain-containing protein, partial [Anaerolineae bacterium]|nr:GAF domain-containing protein [Anaerolineae bacterium]
MNLDALQELQSQFQAILSVMTDLVIVLDVDGRYLEVRGPAELLERPVEELLGKTVQEVLPPDLAEQSLKAIHTSLKQYQLVTIEYSLDVPPQMWFEARIFPIDERRVLSSVRNITPSKLAEMEIARYAERLRILHEIDQSILAAGSPSAIALAALGRLRRLTGCQRATGMELDSQGNVSVLGVEAEQEFSTAMQQRVAVINQEILRQGRPAGIEDLAASSQRSPMQELLFQDGTRAFVVIPMLVHLELIGALLLEAVTPYAFKTEDVDAALEVASLLAVAIRQARLHAALEQRAEQLMQTTQLAQEALTNAQAANRAKSFFLANISHELRTPLNVILGFTQLMTQQPDLNDEQRENLTIIETSGEHLLALINNVLELSKIEAGRTPLQEEDFDLHQMLFELEEMFQQRAKKQHLSMIFEWSREVPRFLHLDHRKLRQILINLLDNAIKFTPSGRVVMRVASATNQGRARNNFLHFEVQDTGPGIAAEEQNGIFAPFWRAETATPLPGTG